MGNKDTVKHSHTVPAAYLANFGIDGNKKRDSMFYFYNVQENKTDKANDTTSLLACLQISTSCGEML